MMDRIRCGESATFRAPARRRGRSEQRNSQFRLASTVSPEVALLCAYQHWSCALFNLRLDLQLDLTELAFGLFHRGIVANGVSSANLINHPRQVRADFFLAGLHRLSAGAFRIFVDIAWRMTFAQR